MKKYLVKFAILLFTATTFMACNNMTNTAQKKMEKQQSSPNGTEKQQSSPNGTEKQQSSPNGTEKQQSSPNGTEIPAALHGEYFGKLRGVPMSIVLDKSGVHLKSQVMSPEYSNIVCANNKNGTWLISCYTANTTPSKDTERVTVLVDTTVDPVTATVTIIPMGREQTICEKPSSTFGFKIEGTVLKGYKGPEPKGTLRIPANITAIDAEAFKGCADLTEIYFPESLENIQATAFNGCRGLKKLEFPKNLARISKDAFSACTGLQTLDFSKSSQLAYIDEKAFAGCTNISGQLILPVNLKKIGSFAFQNCKNISGTLKLPQSLEAIGASAFLNCKAVSVLDFSSCTKLTEIDDGAFNFCTGLTEAKLPASLTQIGNIFTGCTQLATLTIADSNTALCAEQNIVYNKDKTKLLFATPAVTQAVSMPATLTEINDQAFINNKALSKVELPAKLIQIGESAFQDCTNLKTLDFSQCTQLTTIGEYCFNRCTELTGTLKLPDSLKTISSFAFDGCKSITELDISKCTQLTKIDVQAFGGCEKITGTVALPAQLKEIGVYAFADCKGISMFDFSQCTNLTQISVGAFTGCSAAQFKVKSASGLKQKLTQAGVQQDKIQEET